MQCSQKVAAIRGTFLVGGAVAVGFGRSGPFHFVPLVQVVGSRGMNTSSPLNRNSLGNFKSWKY